ncbi:peroxisome assembly factor 2 [Cheilinus undulatus]|uniref:peroxisome assembly factor 2 n=1 Tax=Cheilinus undulatus TaxID=241271 RepID=UPI001BD4A146|nr:peroxisome assembly factor 2 [Cheilinus undulatus]
MSVPKPCCSACNATGRLQCMQSSGGLQKQWRVSAVFPVRPARIEDWTDWEGGVEASLHLQCYGAVTQHHHHHHQLGVTLRIQLRRARVITHNNIRSKMAAQVELCCLESFPSHLSPLDVLMLQCHLDSVFQTDIDPPTLLFTPQRPEGSDRPGILLRVHPTTEEETAGCGGGASRRAELSARAVCLFTSRLFMQLHGLQRLGSRGTIRALEPVSLDRVVLGARSRQSLRRAAEERFTAGLLELCRPGQTLLARRGEPLLLPGEDHGQDRQLDLLVLDCSPVTQGVITAATSVVLTDCWDSVDPLGLAPRGPAPSARPLRLCVSDFAHYADGLGGGRSLLDNRKLLDSGFSGVLQALECRLDVRVVDVGRRIGVDGVDVDSGVFVSKQLLLRLGLFNQEWVKLSRPGGPSRPPMRQNEVRGGGARERLVSVVVVDPSQSPDLQSQDEVGFISETLWFNMSEGEEIPVSSCTLRMKRWRSSAPDAGGSRSDSFCRSASPPFASELHIQLVVSPLYNNLSCCDNLLSEHFSTPRLVSEGDILTVPAEKHPDLLQSNAEGIHRCPVLFFKVQKVCRSADRDEEDRGGGGGAYLADREHTSLYMGASTNSSVPGCCLHGASLFGSLSPPGLNRTVDLLSSIILPHLQHSSLSGCTVLLHGPAGSGKMTAVSAASRRLNLHLLKVDCVSVCADSAAASEVKLSSAFQRAEALQPCILLLRNLQFLLRPRGGAEEDGRLQAALCQLLHSAPTSVVVVATVCRPRDLSAGVMAAFIHQVEVENPNEEQRHLMLVHLSQDLSLGRDVDLQRLAKLTAGFVLGDLSALMVEAGRAACRRLKHTCAGRQEADLCSSGVTIMNQDFSSALQTLQDAQSTVIGAPKIPDVRWEDVGGLQAVKKEILDTVQLPLQRPELLSLGLNRTGVLLYGPPGTGKTLLAKAVATECSMTFLSVKGPELINMYVGQSEENIREVFSRARSAAPCVVFFDELDSLAPSRGRSGDSGGVMDRVVSQLLAELDALHSSVGVFIIGATNRPDLLDQSLLRPGRFDKLVYVGINEDRESQLLVLQAVLRKFQLDETVKLQEVVDQCPIHMTGADLYALCSDAMTVAIKRKISLISDGLDSEDSPVLLTADDFSVALENFTPSVSEQELQRYRNIQQKLTVK